MVTIARSRGIDLLSDSNDHNPAHTPAHIQEDAYSALGTRKWRKLALKLVEDNLDDCWSAWEQFHQD